MPICLPKNKPRIIPAGMGASKLSMLKPCNGTPALAKANTGIII